MPLRWGVRAAAGGEDLNGSSLLESDPSPIWSELRFRGKQLIPVGHQLFAGGDVLGQGNQNDGVQPRVIILGRIVGYIQDGRKGIDDQLFGIIDDMSLKGSVGIQRHEVLECASDGLSSHLYWAASDIKSFGTGSFWRSEGHSRSGIRMKGALEKSFEKRKVEKKSA